MSCLLSKKMGGAHGRATTRIGQLDDKYRVETGQVFITGVQALIKLPLLRRWLDMRQGLNTAGFISGYRGSPLGSYDKQLFARTRTPHQKSHHFPSRHQLRTDATAVWGSQQTALFEGARYDGVFGIWYGKNRALTAPATRRNTPIITDSAGRRAGAGGRRSFVQVVHSAQSERFRLHGRRNPGAQPRRRGGRCWNSG